MSYELSFGEIQNSLWVLHHCDNRPCVNPDHLFLGNQFDNMADMIKKGRAKHAKGDLASRTKITDKQVAEIRRRYAPRGKGGDSAASLAKEFGIRKDHVSDIINYKTRR